MNSPSIFGKKILAISLGFCFVCVVPSYAEKLRTGCVKETLPWNDRASFDFVSKFTASNSSPRNSFRGDVLRQCVDSVAKADIVHLEKTHDSKKDHQNQLEIIKALYQRRRKIAIALEMFQRPHQETINQHPTEKPTKTELTQHWGFPWKLYAPILRYAKTTR
jgi:Haem-binding uptake, Tiki superfamily, ChaN